MGDKRERKLKWNTIYLSLVNHNDPAATNTHRNMSKIAMIKPQKPQRYNLMDDTLEQKAISVISFWIVIIFNFFLHYSNVNRRI